MAIQPNSLICNGRYRVEDLLGAGAFGKIYRATDLSLQVHRALKIIQHDLPGMKEFEHEVRHRFMLEAHLGALLDHPNIVRVFSLEEDASHLIMVMEYAPGGSLADRIVSTRNDGALFSIEEVMKLAVDMANGLSALHSRDVVHRDLKPSNILLDETGQAKISDLGLAQLLGELSQRSMLNSEAASHPGTPAYMSPEHRSAYGYLTPASDVYAFGLILFEILTGRLYKNVRVGTSVLSFRPDTPNWLNDLIERCLLPNPESRPYNGAELIQAIQTLRDQNRKSITQAETKPHIAIYEILNSNAFSIEDLQDLCFRLDIEWETLGGENTKGARVRALVKHFHNKGQLEVLYEAILNLRPQFGKRISILFLTADPTNASRLRLGEEYREIQEQLDLAKQRDNFELHQRTSVRPIDISRAFLDIIPRIVHFSGHGLENGALCFESEGGEMHPVDSQALASLFEQFTFQIHCVILNACYSHLQATAIGKHIPYVIGMSQAIGDRAAIAFAVGFYQALGAGRTIDEAYKLGCVQIRLRNIAEHLTPIMHKRQ